MNSINLKTLLIINPFISYFYKASNNTLEIIILFLFRNFNESFILAFFLFVIKVIEILSPLIVIINTSSKFSLSLFFVKFWRSLRYISLLGIPLLLRDLFGRSLSRRLIGGFSFFIYSGEENSEISLLSSYLYSW